MRYRMDEVLSGMLASMTAQSFTSDPVRLARLFETLATQFPMFAPFGAGVAPAAVGAALKTLESRKILEAKGDMYLLTESGRHTCTSAKRTLFNAGDRAQLEEAGKVLDAEVA